MKKIVLSHNIPLEYYEEYVKDMDVAVPEKPLTCWSRDEAKEVIQDADIFICISDYKMDPELIDCGKKLSIIGNVGSGYDNVAWGYAKSKGIHVLNAPRSVVEATSEMTVALMMSVCRGIVQYDRELRRDLVMTRQLFFYRDTVLYGKTLGVIGMGRIGSMVAKKAAGLGMKIIYSNQFQISAEQEEALGGARYMTAEEVLAQADVVTIHIPLTDATKHFINAEKLAMMKKDAYLINASRGPIVEEAALIEALKNHVIKGAALDVHEFEPNVTPELAELDNVVITPHCCTNVAEVRVGMIHELLDGVASLLKGEQPYNLVC
ncbi:MAG: NAD(P)-binding domain-containing protein [Clostridiales bacterium]|nr:NAD(P)-binding domain-containing protein [Clostridiales bacterium]